MISSLGGGGLKFSVFFFRGGGGGVGGGEVILTGAFVRQGLYVEKNEPFRVTFWTTGMCFF